MRVYVASSWRNEHYPGLVRDLQTRGFEVHDWRHNGFSWKEVDPGWAVWTPEQYLDGLCHERAQEAFQNDMCGLQGADVVIYLGPCGVSASLEAAWAKGAGKPVAAYLPAIREPDLMVLLFDFVTTLYSALIQWLEDTRGSKDYYPSAEVKWEVD